MLQWRCVFFSFHVGKPAIPNISVATLTRKCTNLLLSSSEMIVDHFCLRRDDASSFHPAAHKSHLHGERWGRDGTDGDKMGVLSHNSWIYIWVIFTEGHVTPKTKRWRQYMPLCFYEMQCIVIIQGYTRQQSDGSSWKPVTSGIWNMQLSMDLSSEVLVVLQYWGEVWQEVAMSLPQKEHSYVTCECSTLTYTDGPVT